MYTFVNTFLNFSGVFLLVRVCLRLAGVPIQANGHDHVAVDAGILRPAVIVGDQQAVALCPAEE